MNRDSDSGDSGASSGNEDGPLSPSPEREPEPTVTLAKIFMIKGNGQILDWDGKDPKNNRLFVYADIGNATYKSYMPRNTGSIYDSDFNNMRAEQHDPKGASFLHCSSGSIILPLMEGVHHDIGPLQSNCRIYKDNDNYTDTFWYKLNKDSHGADTEVSTIVGDSIRHIPISEIGNPCSIGKKYTPFCGYIPGRCLFLFKRECNQTYKHKPLKREIGEASLSSLPISKRRHIENASGGKTRRRSRK